MKTTAIRMNVSGISPSLNPVNETRMINANTTPLAPQSATCGKKMKLTRAVTTAVIRMTLTSEAGPYFSSSIGPRSRMYIAFPMKCDHPECPSTCVKNRIYVSGESSDERYVENSSLVLEPPVSIPSNVATNISATMVITTGEFITILILCFIIWSPFFISLI